MQTGSGRCLRVPDVAVMSMEAVPLIQVLITGCELTLVLQIQILSIILARCKAPLVDLIAAPILRLALSWGFASRQRGKRRRDFYCRCLVSLDGDSLDQEGLAYSRREWHQAAAATYCAA